MSRCIEFVFLVVAVLHSLSRLLLLLIAAARAAAAAGAAAAGESGVCTFGAAADERKGERRRREGFGCLQYTYHDAAALLQHQSLQTSCCIQVQCS